MKTYVFDACALIAYLNQETGSEVVERLLKQNGCAKLMSIINVYEVCYDAARVCGVDEGMMLYKNIKTLPIDIIRDIDDLTLRHAIHFKITYAMSVADAFALGLAKTRNATLVTADIHEFDPIDATHELDFHWIR